MYCNYNDILQVSNQEDIIDLINDEKASYNEIDFSLVENACRKRIDEAIKTADAEIDGYLRQRYSLPFTEVPELIKIISRSLTLENLFLRRMPDNIPLSVTNDCRLKRDLLKNISSGYAGLGIETTESKTSAGTYSSNKNSDDRIFSKDELDKY